MAREFLHTSHNGVNVSPSCLRTHLQAPSLQRALAGMPRLEPLLADYLTGKVDFTEVLTAAVNASSGHAQRVSSDSVGRVETVLNDVINTAVEPGVIQAISVPMPGSPILRIESELKERLLTTERELPQLNNHRMF